MDSHAYKVNVPDHDLIRLIGRGSYGEIWIARNIMGSYRAVKVIHRKSFKDDRPYLRELEGIQRFEPISRTHEGFIHVLQIGNNDEHAYFYYIMEIGDDTQTGQKIDPSAYIPHTLAHDMVESDRLTYEACLHLGLALSDALSKLHRQNLVHRDIKPSNIIFVEGQPKLADIGLVTVIRNATTMVGTEGFIPPEGPGSPQGDIYSLGKVLYEISTGKDRFQFPDLPTLLEELPDRESFLEINEVILSACHVDPLKRYPTAEAMHADLAALQGGKSIRRIKQLEHRLEKFKKVAVLTVMFFILLFAALFFYQQNRIQLVEIQQAKVLNKTSAGNQFIDSGEYAIALADFVEALKLNGENSPTTDLHRLQIGVTLSQFPKLTALKFADERLNVVDWLPEKGRILTAGDAGLLTLWSIDSDEPIKRFRVHEGSVKAACFSPDGQSMLTSGSDGWIHIWETDTGRMIHSYQYTNEIWDLAFHPDGHQFVAAARDGRIFFFNFGSDLQLNFMTDPLFGQKAARSVEFSPSGKWLVAGGDNGSALILNPVDHSIQSEFALHHDADIDSVSFNHQETMIVVGSSDGLAQTWSLQNGEILNLLQHTARVVKAQFSPDDRYILTICFDGFVRLWDFKLNRPVLPFIPHSQIVVDSQFDDTGRLILTVCKDGTIRIWDLAGRELPVLLRDNRVPNESFKDWLQRNHDQVDLKHPPMTNTLMDWESGQYAHVMDYPEKTRVKVYSMDGAKISTYELQKPIIEEKDGSVGHQKFDLLELGDSYVLSAVKGMYFINKSNESLQEVIKRKIPFDEYVLGSCSPDGKWIVLGGWNGYAGRQEVLVINPETGELKYPPLEQDFQIRSFAWSADQSYLAVNCSDGDLFGRPVHIWDFKTGLPVAEPLYHLDGVISSEFSPDNHYLLSNGEDKVAIIRDFRTGEMIGMPMQHDAHVQCAAFAPDARILFSARSNVDSVRIWETLTGMPLSPWIPHWFVPNKIKYLEDIGMVVSSTVNFPNFPYHRGMHLLWKVGYEKSSPELLTSMVRLLAGPDNRNAGSGPVTHVVSIKKAWAKVHELKPEFFETKESQILAWHLHEADECEYRLNPKLRNLKAASFHLRQLLKYEPDNLELRRRLQNLERNESGALN